MKYWLLAGATLCCTAVTFGQGQLRFIVDGAVHVDRSCHVQLKPDANGKPAQRKLDALCRITKEKYGSVKRPVMRNGLPHLAEVQLVEMEYTLSNPTNKPLRFELTYRLDKGHAYEPNSGPPPDKFLDGAVVFEKTLAPGEVLPIDLAESK